MGQFQGRQLTESEVFSIAYDFIAHVLGNDPHKSPIERLFSLDCYDRSETWAVLFNALVKEAYEHQKSTSEYYARYHEVSRSIYAHEDFLRSIPPILTTVLKKHRLSLVESEDIILTITSGGTSGEKTYVSLDHSSLAMVAAAGFKAYMDMGLSSKTPTHYLFMGYSPSAANGAATAGTDHLVSHLTPRKSLHYAIDLDANGTIQFDPDACVQYLHQCIKDGSPIRFLGFLHYTCEVIERYYNTHGLLKLPEESYILSGGGWKEFQASYGPKFDLFDFLSQRTNITRSQVRDSYSLAEHPTLFLQCEHNQFHASCFSEVIIRDPQTLQPLPLGEKGLIELVTPIVRSFPSLAILTTDYGSIGGACRCGRASPVLYLHGRAGISKHANCAITSEQYLKASV